MKRSWKIISVVIVIGLVGVLALSAGIILGSSGLIGVSGYQNANNQPDDFAIFWQAWNYVHANFVDQDALDPQQLTYGAIRGMVQALGDEGHTSFLTREERERQQTDLSGKFTGIGAQLGIRDSLPVIVAPFDGSPAQESGVKAGDIIMKVDGEDVTTLTLDDIVSRIRGPEGTQVELSLLRPGETRSLDVQITRGEITIPAASWIMIPGTDVAVVRLSQFSANAADDIIAAVQEAKDTGATALIVDVRNNPGGLLEQAVKVTSQFLTGGDVLLEENSKGERTAYEVESGGIATELPLVVLINPGSASSSEIFAGAIQDHERGTLVGETTFGTGTVLQPFALTDGSALLLGTKQWLTPKGRRIRKQGIEPDEEVILPIETDLLTPLEMREMTEDQIFGSDDQQLIRALELLGVETQADTQ